MKNLIKKMLRESLSKLPNQEMIDRVLDKVSQSGMESLTPEERAILDNPEAEPVKAQYSELNYDEPEEEEDEYGLGINDKDVEYLRLKGVLNKRYQNKLTFFKQGQTNKQGKHEFYYDIKGPNGEVIMKYMPYDALVQMDEIEYGAVFNGVNLDQQSIYLCIATHLSQYKEIGPVMKLDVTNFSDQ